MAEVRRRPVSRTAVKRPRDRVREEETDETEEDEDATSRPARRATRKASPARAKSGVRASRRKVEEDDDPAEDDDEPAPKRSSRARGRGDKKKPPPGIRVGLSGAEETAKAGSGGAYRILPGKDILLVKFLEDTTFASFRQHWVNSGRSGNRPYTCIDEDCPICATGDNPSKAFCLNVLHFTADAEPVNKYLQLGITAWNSLQEMAKTKKTGKLNLTRDYWSVQHVGGKNGRGSVNFKPVQEDDIEEDWEELLDQFDLDEIDDIIADSEDKMFDFEVIPLTPKRELREVAKYMTGDDDDDDDDDDDEDERPRRRRSSSRR